MPYSTAEIAAAGRTTLKGVRIWHEAGLFGEVARDEHGARIFTEAHLQRARIIRAAQMAGLDLARIKVAKDAQLWEDINRAIEFMTDVRHSIFSEYDL